MLLRNASDTLFLQLRHFLSYYFNFGELPYLNAKNIQTSLKERQDNVIKKNIKHKKTPNYVVPGRVHQMAADEVTTAF